MSVDDPQQTFGVYSITSSAVARSHYHAVVRAARLSCSASQMPIGKRPVRSEFLGVPCARNLGRSGLVFGRRPYRRRCAHLVFDGFSRRSRNSRGPLIRRRFRCARSSWVAPWAPNRSISLDASSAALCLALLGPIWRASLDELRSACCNNCRIASGFDGRGAGCAFIQLVSSRSRSGYSLKPIALPMPVFGRPRRRFFLLSDIDRMVKISYQKMPGRARGRAQNGGFHHDPKTLS